MKAIKYEIEVCRSVLDGIHGFNEKFIEVYVPEKGIVFNKEACFRDSGGRVKAGKNKKEIKLDDAFAEELDFFLVTEERCNKQKEKYLK